MNTKGFSTPIVLILLITLGFGVFYIGRLGPKSTPPTTSTASCDQESDCVVGIQNHKVCACPKLINKEEIGKNDWVLYPNLDYTPEKAILIACKPCEPINNPSCQNGVCTPSQTFPSMAEPPMDKTASWKTFTSQNGNFSFAYPHDSSLEDLDSVIYLRTNLTDGVPYQIAISKSWDKKTDSKPVGDLKQYLETKLNIKNGVIEPTYIPYDILSGIRFNVTTFRSIKVGEKEVVRLIAIVSQNQDGGMSASTLMSLDLAFIKTSETNIMSLSGAPWIPGEGPNFMDQILPTFQFTNP